MRTLVFISFFSLLFTLTAEASSHSVKCPFTSILTDLVQIPDAKRVEFKTGMLVKTEKGKRVLIRSNVFDRHEELLEYAKSHFGPVHSIEWAGELKYEGKALKAANETAGIMDPHTARYSAARLEVQGKETKVQNLVDALKKNPEVRVANDARFDQYHPGLSDAEMHLSPDLGSMKIFRHDLINSLSSFSAIDDISSKVSDAELKQLLGMLQKTGNKLSDVAEVLERYGYHRDLSKNVHLRDIRALRAIGERVNREGWSTSSAIRKADLQVINLFMESTHAPSTAIEAIPLKD